MMHGQRNFKLGIMSFYNKHKVHTVKPKVTINKMDLNYITETKFLGIHITESLKRNSHVKVLANKLCKVSFMIKSLRETLSTYMIRNLYFKKISITFMIWHIVMGGYGGVNQIEKFLYFKRV